MRMRINPIRPFALAALFLLTVGLIAALLSGCGDADEPAPSWELPHVAIECDSPVGEPRCFVIAHNADNVEASYGFRLGWWDYDITEARTVYVDSPPPGVVLTVSACNENGCIEESVFIPRSA